MDYRPLGRTGVSVSQLCLGAMMFGAFGNADHGDAVQIIHKALDAGINFIDTADGYSAASRKRSWARRWPADGARAWSSPSSSAFLSVTRTPTTAEHRGDGSPKRSRARCAGFRPTGSTCTKWAFPIRTPISTRPSAPCPTSCAPGRSAPSGRRRFPPLRSSRPSGPPIVAATDGFGPSSPPTPFSPGRSSTTCCRPASATEWASGVQPTGRRLAVGQIPQGAGSQLGRAPPLDCSASQGAGRQQPGKRRQARRR